MDCILSTLSKHSLQRTCKLNWPLNVQENIADDSNELSKWNGWVYGSGYPGQQNEARGWSEVILIAPERSFGRFEG